MGPLRLTQVCFACSLPFLPPVNPFVSQAQVHGEPLLPQNTFLPPSPQQGREQEIFKAKAPHAGCIVCDEPSGATAHEIFTLVCSLFFFFFFSLLLLLLGPMCSAQFRRSCRWRGGTWVLGMEGLEGSKARRDGSQTEDLRGGKATCKGNMEGGKNIYQMRGTMRSKTNLNMG